MCTLWLCGPRFGFGSQRNANVLQVILAELKETCQLYAIKALKKEVVMEDDDIECTMVERRVMQIGERHPFLTHLYGTFQSMVNIVTRSVIPCDLSAVSRVPGKVRGSVSYLSSRGRDWFSLRVVCP